MTTKRKTKWDFNDADREIVRKALEEDGLTCKEAGCLIGLSKQTVGQWRKINNWKTPKMKLKERNIELFNKGRRICTLCSEEKDLDEYAFHRDEKRSDKHGKNSQCRACTSAKSRRNRHKHRVRDLEVHKRWIANNLERKRKAHNIWCRNNRDKMNIYKKKMYRKNPEPFIRGKLERQRILKEKQTPAYADLEIIGIIYLEMSRRNKECGYIAYHVDHIVPLNGELVSGFHVEANLRIITSEENTVKSNSFTPCSDSELPPSELEVSPHLFAVE